MQEKESLMGNRLEIGIFNARDDRAVWYLGGASIHPAWSSLGLKMPISLRARLRTHKVFTKYQFFYLNYHKFSIESYVLDVY